MMTRQRDSSGRPKTRLGRELFRDVVLVLVVKLAIIGIAAVFIFGPNQRPKIDTAKVEAHLIGAPEPVLPQAKDVSNGAAFRRESP